MKMRMFLGGFALGCATMLIAATASFSASQDADPPGGGEMSPEMMEMMKQWEEAMAKYGTPSEEHAELAKRVGSWNVEGQMFQAPGAPAEPFNGTANCQMIMDGRYLFQEFESEFGGQPFHGGGLNGFDRMKNKHVSMWIDDMSTAIMHSEGEMKDGAIHFHGEMPDALAGKYVKSHTVERMIDDNTFEMEMYSPGPDGKMFKSMHLTYRRAE